MKAISLAVIAALSLGFGLSYKVSGLQAAERLDPNAPAFQRCRSKCINGVYHTCRASRVGRGCSCRPTGLAGARGKGRCS